METAPLNPTRRGKLFCCRPQENDGFRIIFFCFGILCLCITIALVISIYLGEPEVLPSGAVASDSHPCSQVGVDVLLAGGNAVDAAVAGTFCMCVVNPHITSIGGGGVMIIHNHRTTKQPVVFNFRETSPALPSIVGENRGSLVGIPGLVRGLWESHKKFGTKPWADLLQPSINLAKKGMTVSSQLADAVQKLQPDSPLRKSELFFPNDIPLAEEQVIVQPKLAKVLESIAENGVQEFYRGPTGQKLVNFMINAGLKWTLDDLENFQVHLENPISSQFGNWTIFTSNAPTSGPQLLSSLNIIKGMNFTLNDQLSMKYFHNLIEVLRISQAQISKTGDPLFSNEVNKTVETMLNQSFADTIGHSINPKDLLPEDKDIPTLPDPIASVVTVMDNNDLYVSIVSGLNSLFGSKMITPDGYLLNDALENFYSNDTLPNHLESQKRPLQSSLPVMVVETNNRCGLRFVSGSPDACQLIQVLVNLMLFNQSAADSIRSARIHAAIQNHLVRVEDKQQPKLPEELLKALDSMGHRINSLDTPYPSVNIVLKSGDMLASQSDSRGGGYAVKYGP